MAEIYNIRDLQTLERFAQREGYTRLADYLPTLYTWNIPVETAAELVRRGISFSEYHNDPSLLEEQLPENVIPIADLYHARDERIAEERRASLETQVRRDVSPIKRKEHPLRTVMYGILAGTIAASALIGLSTIHADPAYLESELLNDPLCTSIEGLYVCLDHSEHGPFFGSYWEYKQLREEL
ncbi:hypothetical protein EXS74_00305 [Candidatus Woesearchaeota archaeon]|nr:hypothetical protein [Candidatus Woesearchaeota archaeon]